MLATFFKILFFLLFLVFCNTTDPSFSSTLSRFLTFSYFQLVIYHNFVLSFWDLPRHQNGVYRFRFSYFWDVLGGIWGRPCELLRASWPPSRPRCPQRAPKTSPGGLPDTPRGLPKAHQGRPRGRKIVPKSIYLLFL